MKYVVDVHGLHDTNTIMTPGGHQSQVDQKYKHLHRNIFSLLYYLTTPLLQGGNALPGQFGNLRPSGLVRCPGQGSANQRKLAHDLAAKAGDVVSYHGDASLLAKIAALCKPYGVYAIEAAKWGWQSVPAKSVLPGIW